MQNFFSAKLLTVIACLLVMECSTQPELFIYPNQDLIIAPVKERLTLECGCKDCGNEDFKYMKWLNKKGKEITENVTKNESTLKLTFSSPGLRDDGIYRCKLLASEAKVIVEFYKPITFEECPAIQNFVLGEPGLIECRVTAFPMPIMIWKKDGNLINSEQISVDEFTVTISSFSKRDLGNYSVEAFVRETGKSLLQNIHVKTFNEITPPEIIGVPKEITIMQGENYTIMCEATGSEPLTYTWYKSYDGMDWREYEDHGHKVDKGLLTILKVNHTVERYDVEYYMCLVRNPAGSDMADVKVKFQRNEICGNRCADDGFLPLLQLLRHSNKDLKKICSIGVERIRCEIQHDEVCLGADVSHRRKYEFLAAYQEIFCSEDTLFHAILLDNLKCLRKTAAIANSYENGPCYFVVDGHLLQRHARMYVAFLEVEGLVQPSDYRNGWHTLQACMKSMIPYACDILDIEDECGTVAMYVYLEIMQKVYSKLNEVCEEQFRLLPEVMRHVKKEEKA